VEREGRTGPALSLMEIAILLLLVLLNGVFAMSETAIVSARKPRLKARADAGDPGAAAALRLLEDPSRMFSTVQIGITLVGVIAGAYGATQIADDLAPVIREYWPAVARWGDEIAFGLVIAATTYLSLVLGELIPKRMAVAAPERIASAVAGPMTLIAGVASPVVFLLKASTEGLLKVLGLGKATGETITDAEIQSLVDEGHSEGVIEPEEREMIAGVLRLGDRTVRSIMTPRPEIVWLDPERSAEDNLDRIRDSRHSRFPVARGGVDNVLGVVQTKDLLCAFGRGTSGFDLEAAMHPALIVPETLPVLRLLETLRAAPVRMALVGDEYGVVQGMVTAADLLEAIAGDVALSPDEAIDRPVQRDDGSWLIDGMTPIDELGGIVGVRVPAEDGVDTAAGLVIRALERIPSAGDKAERGGLHFEVVDMDGLRVDKLLVRKIVPPEDRIPDDG
jgi:putative hemolysin